MKVTKDLFVWKIITHKQASDIYHANITSVYRLYEDDSESMIESEEELLKAYYEKAVMGIEVGQLDFHDLAKKQNIIPVFWSRNDVKDIVEDEEDPLDLTEDEIEQICVELERFHDATIGINWDIIKCVIQNVIDERGENNSN
mgnify:CR=1 FL=1